MSVVSDTSVLSYLFILGEERLLPALFRRVLIPEGVWQELHHLGTPESVRNRLIDPPHWLDIETLPSSLPFPSVPGLHQGEAEAIVLAKHRNAELVLLDDFRARQFATSYGLRVAGTLRVLADAAVQHQLDLADAFTRLRQTTFRASDRLYQQLLAEVARSQGSIEDVESTGQEPTRWD